MPPAFNWYKWYQFVRNDDVRRLTKQPKLTAVWAYYAHGRQRRCQEDPVSLPSGRLEKTTRSSPHHVAQHRPTGSKTTPPCAPRSNRFGSELLSVEDDVDIWRYAIVSCTPETTTTTTSCVTNYFCCHIQPEQLLYDAECAMLAIAKFLVNTDFSMTCCFNVTNYNLQQEVNLA